MQKDRVYRVYMETLAEIAPEDFARLTDEELAAYLLAKKRMSPECEMESKSDLCKRVRSLVYG